MKDLKELPIRVTKDHLYLRIPDHTQGYSSTNTTNYTQVYNMKITHHTLTKK